MKASAPVLAFFFLAASCQLFTESDVVQCKTDNDCVARGGEFADSVCKKSLCLTAKTACQGEVVWELEDPTRTLHTHVLFVDLFQRPVVGATVLVCAQYDLDCKKPLGPPLITDADGYVLAPVPRAFRGTLQVREPPPGFDETFMKTALITFPPIVAEETNATVLPTYSGVRLISRPQLDLLLKVIGTATIPGKAHVLAAAYDCFNHPLSDVSAVASPIDPSVVRFFSDGNDTPSVSATMTAGPATFGFLNVTPGELKIETSYRGKRIGSVRLIMSPDLITTFALPPSPSL